MRDYLRGLSEDQFKKVLDTCIEKVEGLSDKDWQDIVEENNLNIHRDVLRKAFQSPIGGYAVYKYLDDKKVKEVPKSKLDEVKEELGDLFILKQEVRQQTNKLNRIKRDFSKTIIISEDIKESLREDIKDIPSFKKYEPITNIGDNKLIIVLSDIHTGYVIKGYKGNNYNYEIAKKRLAKLMFEAKKYCDTYNITNITVVNCGDVIENLYMRENQSYECEFNLSEQISKATVLLYGFISELSKSYNVDFYSVGGNHSRMSSKDANIEGDNANVIIVDQIKNLVEVTENKRITIGETDFKDDSCVFEVNGIKTKVIHGDNRVKEDKKLFDGEISMDDSHYNLILRGHYHAFNISSHNNGVVVTTGCLFGYNPYSVKKMSCKTGASQTLIVVGNNEIENIKNVNLQDIN